MSIAIDSSKLRLIDGAGGVRKFRKNPQFQLALDELLIDAFAGGGGASTGIEWATGRSVDIAINHDVDAISQHQVNHPQTKHYNESIWAVDPIKACQGRKVGLMWFSPDCRHFSRAKSGKPVNRNIRGLAWTVLKWAGTVRPRVICLENVPEFVTWTRLTRSQRQDKTRKGETFLKWKAQLERLGYHIEFRTMKCSDYGVPTTRTRFFLVARCDGAPIVWPEITHGNAAGLLEPASAADHVIDWNEKCNTIFGRKKPLVPKTMIRIARGIEKFVLLSSDPYIVPIDKCNNGNIPDNRKHCIAFISKQYGGNYKAAGIDVRMPTDTVTSIDHHMLVCCYLTKFRGSNLGTDINDPVPTISSQGTHVGEVRVYLKRYLGNKIDFADGIIVLNGETYQIHDIALRMLQPHELYKAHGFPDDYVIDRDAEGNSFTKKTQVAKVGNSVPPKMAELMVLGNYFQKHNTAKTARLAEAC